MSGDVFCVVDEHPRLIEYVDSLQRKNAEALSFYPRQVFERESRHRRIILSILNGDPCGYLYMGGGRGGVMRCHQVCIQYDARRLQYAAALVAEMERRAVALGCWFARLRCGFDLEANKFWPAMGYACIATEKGGVRRMRTINVWQRSVAAVLLSPVAVEAAAGKTSAAVWLARKQVGMVTQFSRGAAIRDYRSLIEGAGP